ncbi:MAG: multicopper oxidase family protein [Cyanobacteria bacterium J06634_6]
MKRRQFNRYLGQGLAAMGLGPLLTQCDRAQPLSGQSGLPYQALPLLTSQNGVLEASLTAQWKVSGNARKQLSYNGHAPGPIIEARPGDTVRLTLTNELDSSTNLHFHGLHISPDIDNVFREVTAGGSYTYEFQIPDNHPAVTGWYHPHYHGLVAQQVFGGLAGPIIIRGDLDDIPEIQQAEEALLVLQDFDAALVESPEILSPLAKKWGREGVVLLANGQQNPIIELPQDGLLRLRLINASASRIYQLQLKNHPWHLMATDRGAIAEPTELETLSLSPGERAELLIPGQRQPGSYPILSLPYDRGIGDMLSAMGDAMQQMPGLAPSKTTTLATLRYAARQRTVPVPLPKQLIPVASIATPVTTREFVLNHGNDASTKTAGFIINNQAFAMGRVDTQVSLNTVEDWHIINKASMDHPFHLHTNRFQVIERNGKPESLRAWKDTVAIGGYETVTLRVKFEDFTGRTVYHCHILDHEDQGMMGIVEIT